jgi:hypothetical protein
MLGWRRRPAGKGEPLAVAFDVRRNVTAGDSRRNSCPLLLIMMRMAKTVRIGLDVGFYFLVKVTVFVATGRAVASAVFMAGISVSVRKVFCEG